MSQQEMRDADYALLAEFRATLRQFMAFSESQARNVGLTPQQHQALLAIRGAAPEAATIGYVAEKLLLKPHSASGLISRLEEAGLVERQPDERDQRRSLLRLTEQAESLLRALSLVHLAELGNLKPLLQNLIDRV